MSGISTVYSAALPLVSDPLLPTWAATRYIAPLVRFPPASTTHHNMVCWPKAANNVLPSASFVRMMPHHGRHSHRVRILGNSHSRVTTAAATARHIRMSALLVTMDVMKTFELFFLFGPLLFWCFLLPSHHNARQLEETRFSYISTSPIVLLIVARLLIAPSCNDESPYVL